jgi:hypothetical protein
MVLERRVRAGLSAFGLGDGEPSRTRTPFLEGPAPVKIPPVDVLAERNTHSHATLQLGDVDRSKPGTLSAYSRPKADTHQ